MNFFKKFFKHPRVIIALCLVITAVLGFFIKDLRIDNSIRQFLPQKDASYSRLVKTENQFGSMIVIGVSLESTDGDILTPENIQVVRNITDKVLELKDVDDIDSLTHIDYVCESDGSISASQLIPDSYAGSPEDIAQLKGRLTEWSDMYNRVIVNDDNSATQMQITIHSPTEAEKTEEIANAKKENRRPITDARRQQNALDQIREIVTQETQNHNLVFKIFGDPVVSENARSFMLSDLTGLIPLVIVVVLLSLYFSFKTLDGTLLPLITVVMSAVWTMGIMSIFRVTFTLVSSVIPVALIAVGSAYGIHVLNHYYVALESAGTNLTKEVYEETVAKALRDVMLAVVLAGVTTIVGFISLISSPIAPLHSFAVFTALGVGFSLILAIVFIPALLLCKSVNKVNARKEKKSHIPEKLQKKLERAKQLRGGKSAAEASGNTLYTIYHFFCGSKVRLVLFVVVIAALSYVGIKSLHIDTALVNYFPSTSVLRKDIDYVDKQFAGTNSVYFVISGQEKGDLTKPEILKAVDDMQNYLEQDFDEIGKIVSYTTFIKRINQVWHVPSEQNIVTDENTASDSSDDFESLSFESFGDDSFSSFADDFAADSDAAEDSTPADWVDPNIAYTEKLNQTMTTQQVLDMLARAYVEAGGKYATVEKMMKCLEEEMNYNGMAYYEIPYDVSKYPVPSKEELSGVVQGYLTLLSGSLGRFVDDDMNPMVMRVTCQLRNHSTETTGKIIKAAQDYAAEHFPEGFTLEATGAGEMEYTMTNMIVSSQLSSLLTSLVSVFIIIAIAFHSAWAGLVGAIPLALAIVLNYMVMGFTGINLDLVTSIIASVAVGVGIDYTIHFMTTYREERALSDNLEEVTRQTFKKSGHGIVTNALAVGFGFLVLCFSRFVVLRYIGFLVAIVMFTSSFFAMTVIPGILNLFEPKFIRPKEGKETKTSEKKVLENNNSEEK